MGSSKHEDWGRGLKQTCWLALGTWLLKLTSFVSKITMRRICMKGLISPRTKVNTTWSRALSPQSHPRRPAGSVDSEPTPWSKSKTWPHQPSAAQILDSQTHDSYALITWLLFEQLRIGAVGYVTLLCQQVSKTALNRHTLGKKETHYSDHQKSKEVYTYTCPMNGNNVKPHSWH